MKQIHSVLAAIVVLATAGPDACAADRPNVLFLFTDDQRADTIGALGNQTIQTPNLDRIAQSGFVFQNAYCMGSTMSAVCNPSRHMLISGKSLYRYDPRNRQGTFADVMNQAGYVSWHIGKRGNTPHEYHRAFHYSAYVQDDRERTSGHHGRAAAEAAMDFLKGKWERDKPLFMYIAFEGPHDPRVAANEWMDLYRRDQIPLPKNYLPLHPVNNGDLVVRDEQLAPWPRTEADVRQHLHDYYACISSIDHQIGRILKTFEELGELDNTIIVFSSDHGLAVGSHGLFGKQNVYEDGLGVPLMFSGPGIPRGSSGAFAYLYDIFPTVAEFAEAKAPPDLDGISLAPVIRGQKKQVRDTVFLAYKDVQRAVRHGDWKLIRYPQIHYTQLFDLNADPHETTNLAERAEHAPKVSELMALLGKEQRRFGDSAALSVESPQPAAVDVAFIHQEVEKAAKASPSKKKAKKRAQ